MRLVIPLTGTLRADGSGDPDDPVRIIPVSLGDLAWRAVSFDFEAGTVEVEAEVPQHNGEERLAYEARSASVLSDAQAALEHTADELYALTGAARLKRKDGME